MTRSYTPGQTQTRPQRRQAGDSLVHTWSNTAPPPLSGDKQVTRSYTPGQTQTPTQQRQAGDSLVHTWSNTDPPQRRQAGDSLVHTWSNTAPPPPSNLHNPSIIYNSFILPFVTYTTGDMQGSYTFQIMELKAFQGFSRPFHG